MSASNRRSASHPRVPHLRSMRTRLIAWNVLTLAVMFLLLGVFVRATVWARLIASVDRELATRMRPLAQPRPGRGGPDGAGLGPGQGPGPGPGLGRGPGMGGWRGPQTGPPGPPGPMISPDGTAYLPRVMDPQGRVLAPEGATEPWDATTLKPTQDRRPVFTTVDMKGTPVRVMTLVVPRIGPVERILQLPYPLADVERAMSGLTWTLLAFTPLVLFFAGWGGAILTDRVLRPVRQIRQAASGIGAEHLGARLPVSGEDEFAELSAAFNAMLSRLESAFRDQERLVEELRRMVEQQRRFTADASHELRTPLTVIKANTSLALSGAPALDEVRQSMEDIDRAADTASRLVGDLLLLARSDAGQLGRGKVVLPVRELLARAVAELPRSGGAPVCLTALDAGLRVLGNEDELTRVVKNLVENAIRYTPEEGSITVSAEGDGRDVHIRVADTGIGIAPEHLPHLGERFYRVDPARTRRAGGAGLGLSIVKGIVEANGGHLAIRSAPGAGTTVTVTLPAASDDVATTA